MMLRFSLRVVVCAWACAWVGAVGVSTAPADDAAPPPAADAAEASAVVDEAREPAPLTWRVRRTQAVLDEHFAEEGFRIKRTAQFVLLHNTAPERAATRAALLELTHQRFFEAFGDFYDLDDAERPLVCVLFADEDAYARYARRVDRLDMSWAGGYYSSRTNRMVLYDAPTDAPADERCERCGERHEPEAAKVPVSDVDASDPETLLLAAAEEAGAAASPPLNLASTTHEAAHQLAFNTGLQRRGVMYPFWVSEGLACAFETNSPDEPFGLGKPNPNRLEDLRGAMRRDALIELERFVSMTRPPTRDRQRLNGIYAQAWALFQYLYLHERDALAAYLRTLADLPAGRRSERKLRREFTDAFGPIEQLEERWQAHLKTLR